MGLQGGNSCITASVGFALCVCAFVCERENEKVAWLGGFESVSA